MKLYEFFTFLIITGLILAFSAELGYVFVTGHERNCYKENQYMLTTGKQGPPRPCEVQ